MRKQARHQIPDLPIDKEKVKAYIPILELSRMYSAQIRENTRRPLIICPFHPDKTLGSCRIYTDTNTFKCESCGAHGDMLKLASGFLGIPLSDMNELLERLIQEFGIPKDSVRVDYTPGAKKQPPPAERLTPEEYKELMHSDHYSIPTQYEEVEYEEGIFDYVPQSKITIYYRSLAVKDPEFHDWVVCTVSRIYWLRYAQMLDHCQKIGFILMEEVLTEKLKNASKLLRKALINKSLFRPELRLRNELLNEELMQKALSA